MIPSATANRTLAESATDPIVLQIIRYELLAAPNQIEKNIERTAFSQLVQEYKDYSVGFVDGEGRLVAQSRGSLPIFVANALGVAVREGLAIHGEENIHDGDIFFTNTAAVLGQHLNNVVAYTPVRHGGRLLGFFAVLVHWIDLGGIVPGSCVSPSTTDVWQEGVQYPAIKIISKGERLRDVFRLIETNTRYPRLLLGDLEAQLGGCLQGCQMVKDIIARRGTDVFEEAVRLMWSDADAAVGRALADLPPGEYRAESFLDDDGIARGRRIKVAVKVIVEGGKVTIDLSECSDQNVGPFNAGRNGGAVAAARIAFKYLFAPDTPANDGDFARLHVEIPDGRFLSATKEAPIGGSGNIIPTTVDTILKALGEIFPERTAAAHHGIYGVHTFFGKDRTGEPFVHIDTVTGGWGASSSSDGPGPFRSNVHGDVLDVPVEMQEVLLPYRILAKELRPDTGGAGKFRGGIGVEKRYLITGDCEIIGRFERTECPPWGIEGGHAGATAQIDISRPSGEDETLIKGQRRLVPGDRLRIVSGGGGGFGNPLERDLSLVARDVIDGYVSAQQAMAVYGVEADEAGSARRTGNADPRKPALRTGETGS